MSEPQATARSLPIRVLVAMIVVVPVVVLSVALVTLSTITSRRIAENLARSIVDSTTRQVRQQVSDYLGSAVRTSDLYTRRMASGSLPTRTLDGWSGVMFDDLKTSPDVASICFGNTEGDTVWLLRGPGRLELGRADGAHGGAAVEYAVDDAGRPTGAPLRVYTYDPRERPWYKVALENAAKGPRWTPIYFWFGNQGADSTTGSGYTRAIRGADGTTTGVLVIDVTLGALSNFVHAAAAGATGGGIGDGGVFIVDGEGLMVAASRGPVNTDKGERCPLTDAADPAARAASAVHMQPGSAVDAVRVPLGDGFARVTATKLDPYPGLDWTLLVVLPESVFMGDAASVQRRSVVMAVVACVGAMLLGLALARRLSQPLLTLTSHVRRIGEGDFESQLELNAAREFTELSSALNRMSGDLKDRMELEKSISVAREVQMSLLPTHDPKPGRLDIAGRTRYCDATGGDYFDFIDVSPVAPHSTLVALGDVTGHGVGAALLMASARAALRAHTGSEPALGGLLTRVNDVLAADGRNKQFMTMVLTVFAEGADGVEGVRWASAGHDPTIVYHPHTDEFEDLEGGDLPLGIMPEIAYEEYSKAGFREGDVFMIGTDGIWEMRNGPEPGEGEDEVGEMFGKDRLREFLRKHHAGSAREIADALERTLAEFRGDRKAQDDVTYVVVKIEGTGRP